jgi:fatty-acid peroxygenase
VPSDEVVLVLGASSGIGLATCLRLARDGARLVLAARSGESLAIAEQQCRDAGAAAATAIVADITDPDEVRTAVERAVQLHGRLDVVVLTAAVMAYGSIESVPPEIFEHVVDTAVVGTANVARAALSAFRRQGRGTLIVVNSLLGSVTVPEMGAYTTAKWAQRALVRTLQQELRSERGIAVCLVSPGSVNTPIYYQAANFLGRAARPPFPVRSPEQVADVIARLARRPQQHVSLPVGPLNPLIISGFRLLPVVYDRIVGTAFRLASMTSDQVQPHLGNVESPTPKDERMHGHWPDPPTESPPAARTTPRTWAEQGIALLRGGYPYLAKIRAGSPAAVIRLMGRRTAVVAGPEGARLFYDESLMQREGAVPGPVRRTLFGEGAVHGLDDAAHKHRKAMFTGVLTAQAAREVADQAATRWRSVAAEDLDPVHVFDSAVEVHTRAVCTWAGVPETAVDARLASDLIAMVDGFGSAGPRHLRARRARHHRDRWAADTVRQARDAELTDTALGELAHHRDEHGALLSAQVAGVELLNILRPTAAAAYFVAFSAHALTRDPQLRTWLAAGEDRRYEAFAHEVRRFYPFVPMLAARVRRDESFEGVRLSRGRRVLLDVYGTLHDPDVWTEPERFDPARFLNVEPDPFSLIPQGGGDPQHGHRCPGERLAIELIKTAADVLVTRMPQHCDTYVIPLDRFPTRPFGEGTKS